MRPAIWLLALGLVFPAGCFDGILEGSDVRHTQLVEDGKGWNRDGRFRVLAQADDAITIEATATDGRTVRGEGVGDVTLAIPDGTWDIRFEAGGEKGRLTGVRIDSTAPDPEGLELVGQADDDGRYVLGEGYAPEPGSRVEVRDSGGNLVGTALPVTLLGLQGGLHVYLVNLTDAAGNSAERAVHVRAGATRDLPEGDFTFGIVARYTLEARVWDISLPERYLSPADAAAQVEGDFLGSGWGVTPDDPAVLDAVGAAALDPGMTTMEAALALFRWFADELEYDEGRLTDASRLDDAPDGDLLTPAQTLQDSEDPRGDRDRDGLADDGKGNGVRGGVCRDLAAAFVSLLRAAGVPARLVSGYLDGNVDGFHAWVEFYAGSVDGQLPWVPVDVSLVDGPATADMVLQAFGVERPDYLPLRALPPGPERKGWSTAAAVAAEWPGGEDAPDVRLRKDVAAAFDHEGVLCFDPGTMRRALAASAAACPPGLDHYVPGFALGSQRTIDYGVEVLSAPRGATVEVTLSYPFASAVAPDDVVYASYGARVDEDERDGTLSARLRF